MSRKIITPLVKSIRDGDAKVSSTLRFQQGSTLGFPLPPSSTPASRNQSPYFFLDQFSQFLFRERGQGARGEKTLEIPGESMPTVIRESSTGVALLWEEDAAVVGPGSRKWGGGQGNEQKRSHGFTPRALHI